MNRYIYICKEFILWRWNVFRLFISMVLAWCLYKYEPIQENRTLYLCCKNSYQRMR